MLKWMLVQEAAQMPALLACFAAQKGCRQRRLWSGVPAAQTLAGAARRWPFALAARLDSLQQNHVSLMTAGRSL